MTLRLRGSSSQYVDINASPNAGDATLTLPTDSGTVTVRDASGGTNVGTGVTIGNPSANTLTVSNSGGERFRITAAGSVGINTAVGASVGLNLHQISGAAAQVRFQGSVTGTGEGDGFGLGNSGTVDAYVWNYEAGHIQFATSNSPRLTITSVGRMLLGTTAEGHESADDFTVSDSGDVGITIRSTDSNQTQISFSDATSGTGEYAGQISYFHTDNYMRFRTNSEERIRINSAGLVGIGTDNPTKALHLTQNTDCAIRIDANNSNANARAWEIVVGGNASNNAEMVLRTRQDDGTGGSECARFTRSGSIKLPSGGGIDFHNYGSGSSIDSNLLDDYEEGTWTPVIKSGNNTISYTGGTQYFTYIKIGNKVTLSFNLSAATTSGTIGGAFTMEGIPFLGAANSRNIGSLCNFYGSGLRPTNWPSFIHIDATSNFDIYYKTASNSNYDRDTVAEVGTNTYMMWTATYFVD